jgi:DNA invertase Pin-like site-specific DNA recombinase
MSLAILGDTTKVEDQERICRQLAETRGWTVAAVYTDNNLSAWNRKVVRPGWQAMLKAVDKGEVNAIVAYHGDRLYRQPRDLEKLIDLAEGKGIRLASPMGEYDLGKSSDRIMARVMAAMQEGESARTSERRKTQYERWRREGRVRAGGRGGRAFGFESDGVTQIPLEADLIREAARRVLAGEGVGDICRDWTNRGIVTTTGIPFSHGTLRKLLARPRYAGLMPDGVSKAAWDPVLDRETWEQVSAVLNARAAGFGYATNTRKHLLSGIALCGTCGKPLRAKMSQGKGNRRYQTGYTCVTPGCKGVWRDRDGLDAYVGRMTVNRLDHPDKPAPRAPEHPGLAAEFATLTTALKETDDALEDISGGAIGPLRARRKGIVQRLAELRDLAAGDAAARLRSAHQGVTWDEWPGLPLQVRRSLVAACFRVTVLPASKRGPGFRAEDVRMEPL